MPNMSDPKKYRFLFSVAMFSGNATIFHNMKKAVSRMPEIEATWLPVEVELTEWFTKIPPLSMNWSLKGGLVTRRRILALERSGKKFDAALFHHQILVLWLRSFRKRVPTVITMDATPRLHDQYARWYVKNVGPKSPLLQKIKQTPVRLVYQDAAYVLPFSHWVGNSLVQDYGVDNRKIVVIPPGLDLDFWSKARMGGVRQRQHGEPTRILFVGGDFMRKGGDLLLRAANKQEFHHCEFHFVTKSFCGKASENIFVYTDLQANDERLLNLYRSADIFVLPTRSDFYSLASMEAMAMSLPVIVTNVGGIGEIIDDGKSGFIIPVDDEEALTDRLRILVNNEGMRREFGEIGRRIVEEKFDLQKNASQTVELMKEAVITHRARLKT